MNLKIFNVTLWELYQNTSVLMVKVRQRELSQYGVTLSSLSALNTIVELGEAVTISNIARRIGLEIPSISAQLNRMQKEGLIEKSKNRGKRKLIKISITDKGYEILEKTSDRKAINSIMSALTDEEKHRLWAIIIKIREQSVSELGKMNYDISPFLDANEMATHFE
jgi:DNA-binding MarR family transcriptional regulator